MRTFLGVVRACAVAATLVASVAWIPVSLPTRPGEDPSNVQYVFQADSSTGRIVRATRPLPRSIFHLRLAPLPKREFTPGVASRIHPALDSLIQTLPESTRVIVLITYRDPYHLPRFPVRALEGMPWTSVDSLQSIQQADSLIQSIQTQRDSLYDRNTTQLTLADPRTVVLRKYWIIQGLLAEMRLGSVKTLLHEDPDVTFIAPNASGEPAPGCAGFSASALNCGASNALLRDCLCRTLSVVANTPRVARGRVGADSSPWDQYGETGPVALFDSGVRSTHVAFNSLSPSASPQHLRTLKDLVDHAKLGDGLSASAEDGDPVGHGTSSAAILSSLECPSDEFRGVTNAALDAFNVYEPSGPQVGLIHDAVLLAFQNAIFDASTGNLLDPVVVAEMQALGPDLSDINLAADNAFACGAAVIAPQGNADEVVGGQVASPGRARWAIGVGAYSVTDYASPPSISGQCSGPAVDGRVKPDLIAPTNTWVAGSREGSSTCKKNDDHAFHGFTATSGATPYVGGLAALLSREFSKLTPPAHDPGNVYAGLIVSGRQPWTGTPSTPTVHFDPDRGVGSLLMPDLAKKLFAGNATVPTTTVTCDIPIDLGGLSGLTNLEAGVWWPDPKVEHWTWEYHTVEIEFEPPWIPWPRPWFGVPWLDPPGVPPTLLHRLFKLVIPVKVPQPVTYEHSDVDIELIPPGATAAAAYSMDDPTVFERATAPVNSRYGIWTLRISAASLPGGPQKVYYAVTAR